MKFFIDTANLAQIKEAQDLGVLDGVTTNPSLMAKEGIKHLGYPEYFGTVLAVFKVIGTLILIIPPIGNRLKEWAYAGFFFDFVFAFISYLAVDGLSASAFFPLLVLVILAFFNSRIS